MLDYNEVKRFYAGKLAQDMEGTGRIESAFYHTMKMVYLKGVEDGLKDGVLRADEAPHVGIVDCRQSEVA